jgi:hypothetical protein
MTFLATKPVIPGRTVKKERPQSPAQLSRPFPPSSVSPRKVPLEVVHSCHILPDKLRGSCFPAHGHHDTSQGMVQIPVREDSPIIFTETYLALLHDNSINIKKPSTTSLSLPSITPRIRSRLLPERHPKTHQRRDQQRSHGIIFPAPRPLATRHRLLLR